MRLIDGETLKKAIRAESWENTTKMQLALDYIDILIDEQPTVDAIIPVRCRDCKHWDYGDCYRIELSRPDDYCSYGERRCKDG